MAKQMSYRDAAVIYRKQGANLPLCKDFATVWNDNDFLVSAPITDDWDRTVTIWGHFGLIREDFEQFSRYIENRGDSLPAGARWKYFCGCAWNMINAVKQIAEEGAANGPEGNSVGDE